MDGWSDQRSEPRYPCGEGRLAVLGEGAGCWLGTGASNNARSMSYPIAEVLGRVERRRRFSVEQKVAVLAEATAPGANMSEVARGTDYCRPRCTSGAAWLSWGLLACRAPPNFRRLWPSRSPRSARSLPVLVPEGKPAAVDG